MFENSIAEIYCQNKYFYCQKTPDFSMTLLAKMIVPQADVHESKNALPPPKTSGRTPTRHPWPPISCRTASDGHNSIYLTVSNLDQKYFPPPK